MDKVQKHDSFKCSTPLSEPFKHPIFSCVQLNSCMSSLYFQAARQQLERLPRRQTQTASSANSASAGTATAATAATTAVPLDASSSQVAQSNSQFLLSR